jgi:outer membrane protein assembly complex protein YaeT
MAVPAAAQDMSCDRGDRETRSLRFTGNSEFTSVELAASVVTQPSSFAGLPVFGERRCLDPGEFARDVRRLETLYRRRGFPDVKVDTIVRTRRPGVIDITFAIVEGRPVRVASLAILGLDQATDARDAARDFPLRTGGVFDRGALEAGRDSIVRRLRNRGWPQAEALLAYTTDDSARTADVEVAVVPGVRARLGRIAIDVDTSVTGRRRIEDATIRRTMALRTGDWYSAREIIDAQRNLYQTDAFLRVDLLPDSLQPPGDSIVNLTVRVVEGDQYAARAGLGWATLDCFRMQGGLTDRDFLPFAQRLEVNARVSKIGIGAPLDRARGLCQGQARSDPYSRTLNYYVSMSVQQPIRARQSRVPTFTLFSSTLSEYKAFLRRTPIGGVLSVTNPLQSRLPSILAYQVELGRTEAEPAFFCAVFNACDTESRSFLQRNNRLAAIDYSVSRERTNDRFRPTGGTTLRFGVRHASTLIGSDKTQQFNRGTGDATWYGSLGNGVRILTHLRGGVVYGGGITPTLGQFIPPQERLYAGGPTTVRGFRQNELGPAVYIVNGYRQVSEGGETYFRADSGNAAERVVPTGGNTLVVGNLEVTIPSPVAPRLLDLAVFADAGRLWNRGAGSRGGSLVDDGPKVKVTPGVGVRITSPFGAIRIDLGYNPYRLPTGAAYFNEAAFFDPATGISIAPLYCVSPGNALAVRPGTSANAPPVQDAGPCPGTFRPDRGKSFLRRLNPSIWIGQAF